MCRKSINFGEEEGKEKKNCKNSYQQRCKALTRKKEQCKNSIGSNSLDGYCWIHSVKLKRKEEKQQETENTNHHDVNLNETISISLEYSNPSIIAEQFSLWESFHPKEKRETQKKLKNCLVM